MYRFLTTITILLWLISTGFTQVRLPKYISDGIVLQRNQPAKIWGYAAPGEKIKITFNKKQYNTSTLSSGKWQIILPPHGAGGPYIMYIKGSTDVVVKDILFGDVWVCSGQSNMEFTMERLSDAYPDVFNTASNPNIRQFTVPQEYDFTSPREDFTYGAWMAVSPTTISNFSGVGYFFASKIYAETKIPIGLVNNALGGSPAQAWINEDGLKNFPDYLQEAYKYRNKSFVDSINTLNAQRAASWLFSVNNTDDGVLKKWHQTTTDRSDWKTIQMPSKWKDEGLSLRSGSIWLHKTFEIDAEKIKYPCRLFLGCIVDADSVYINGHFVGTTSYQYPPRKYNIPKNLLRAGKNDITIRVLDQSAHGGFVKDKPYHILYEDGTIVSLAGIWQYKIGNQINNIEPHIFVRWKPLGLYNAMLAPLTDFKVTGILWYQGESNTGKPEEYCSLMNTLIEQWRTAWQKPDLPFYFVQLANFMEAKKEPTESNWAALRQQQLDMLKIPNTGMAVTIDIGEWNDIHPLNKKCVGERLALHALKNQYGRKKLIVSGPLVKSCYLIKNKVVLDFDYVKNGIKKVDNIKYFEIADEDKKFVTPTVIIKGKSVILENAKIDIPKYVRYAWADNPEQVNFYNTEGLPASPFEWKIK